MINKSMCMDDEVMITENMFILKKVPLQTKRWGHRLPISFVS